MIKNIAVSLLVLFCTDISYSQILTDNTTCLMGSGQIRTYADQMENFEPYQDNLFLLSYQISQIQKGFNSTFFKSKKDSRKEYISKEKIYCSMKRIPHITQTKKICSSSKDVGYQTKETPCITEAMVDYIHWSINEAFQCFGEYLDDFERKIIFRKINQESAFGFFYDYKGGSGITQLIQPAKKEMFFSQHQGYQFLDDHIKSHPKECKSFKNLIRQPSDEKITSCEYLTLGNGIGKNLLGGIGLYLYYRSGPKNYYSAERLLSYWGFYKTDSKYYKEARSLITLGMYNKGPHAVLNEVKERIAKSSLQSLGPKRSFQKITEILKKTSFRKYAYLVRNGGNHLFSEDGSCRITTIGVLSYPRSKLPLSSLQRVSDEHEMSEQYLQLSL